MSVILFSFDSISCYKNCKEFCIDLNLFTQNSSSPNDEDFRRMEQKLTELTTELHKKDQTLKQISALLPWKLLTTKGSHSVDNKDQDGYMCSLSEDKFIV